MVTTYIKQSISIKKSDEVDFNEFIEFSKKDPIFIENRGEGDEKRQEFIGISGVFTKLWKSYLRGKQEEQEHA